MNRKTVFITGATGVMGFETLKQFASRLDRFNLRLLVRPSRRNRRKLAPYLKHDAITVTWGNLLNATDVKEAMGNADIVLHIGGMVSPLADHFPQETMNVNVNAARNIVAAIKERSDRDGVKLVYIGSVAETGGHDAGCRWGRIGDPIIVSPYDYYGISKVLAERVVAESGLKHWVVLRQSGILHPGLLMKGMDPITFHVPLNGVLEWTTLEDSGRLMANICEEGVPEALWRNFYNIGSGEPFRLSNYEFEQKLLKALGCPPPEKIFEPRWFATRNFHGQYFEDSDLLEQLVPFREKITADEYFARMSRALPFFFKLAPLCPAFLMKAVMKRIASASLEPMKIKAMWKSENHKARIGGWEAYVPEDAHGNPTRLDHGYDETKSELTIDDIRRAAEFRGGKCLSTAMDGMDSPLQWQCAFGHEFTATPRLVLKGGHWCEHCLPAPWRYDAEARVNPFLAQVWHAGHDKEENNIYDSETKITRP